MKKSKQSRNTEKLALASLFAALCFVLMYFGTVTVVFDLCAVTVSALIIIISVIEIGGMYPWLIWVVCGVLYLLILPDKYVALEFVLYGGIYPMLKSFFERFPKFVSWIFKLLYFNAAFTASVFVAKYVFAMSDIGFELKITAYLLANIFFIMSDVCFSLLISIYIYRIRPRLKLNRKK